VTFVGNNNSTQLSDLEAELVGFFVNAAQAFGLPKSVGEIYGLYFASDAPLALDQVVEKLQISKGSASQGIRFLRSINALDPAYLPGDRRDHYVAQTSLRVIAEGFINERIRPQLRDSSERLRAIKRRYDPEQVAPLSEKLSSIESWGKKAEFLLPFVGKFKSHE